MDLTKRDIRKYFSDVICKELPENYLEDLYYGNLEFGVYSGKAYNEETNRKIIEIQDQLKVQLTEEQWELLKQYSALVNERECEECYQRFLQGYRTAMYLILAGICDAESGKQEEK